MRQEAYQILEILDESEGDWVEEKDLKEDFVERTSLNEDCFDNGMDQLKRQGLIKEGNSGIQIRRKEGAHRILATKRLRDSIRNLDSSLDRLNQRLVTLKSFQARSAAVETVFTLAILLFTLEQAANLGLGDYFLSSIAVIAIIIALSLGGVNLVKQSLGVIENLSNRIRDKF